ncbi:chloride intracellular channel exc-4-like [Limulus polyphemus]|uniref:Chloride intracellular channel exc-4-like n=1 Tax=Limulus polyphemus TaxID=6850 RepID=A0ABM1BUG4_LIMPO|nr:chloride intracellular channel exc-4-like [Limulus polyphemus]
MSEENHDGSLDGSESQDIPEIELIIRASTIDGRRKGACLFCQEYFMDLYLLAELKTISLKVTTVDMLKPPPDFRSNFDSTPPPILVDNGQSILENDKIERYIMKNVPGGYNLFIQDKQTATVIENLYSKFKLVLTREGESTKRALLNQLSNINSHLSTRQGRFLTGDTMCCFDCELMPRLQHIRVAGKYFSDFDIPVELTNLWRYMYHMYQLDAFTQSCPADQDIINHYKLQLQRSANRSKKHEELETPTYTTSIPSSADINGH